MDYSQQQSSSPSTIPPCPVPPLSSAAEKEKRMESTTESTFEEEKKHHFKPEDLANAMIHDNAFLSCCLGPDRYSAALSTPFSLIVLGPPFDGQEIRGGSYNLSSLSHWFSSSISGGGGGAGGDQRSFLQSLWKTASYRVCCDGAYDMVLKSGGDNSIKPDLLIGHLEELTDQTKSEIERERNDKTKSFINNKGGITTNIESPPSTKKIPKDWNEVEIARETSDEWTDLQKALWKMKEQKEKLLTSNPEFHHTIVCYYDGPIGRLDKLLSHINALYQFHNIFPRILLLTDNSSITELLSPGHHILLPNKELEGIYSSCGIFPIGSSCRKIYTTGLHWPLHGDTLAFGGLISTCNAIVSDRVLIENSDPVIFHTNLLTMNTPLQRIRSLVTKEGISQRSSQSTPSSSSSSIGGGAGGASFGSSAPKTTGGEVGGGSMGDIVGGGRTQSLTESNKGVPAEKIGINNNNNQQQQSIDESMLHHEHGFAQQEPLVPNPSTTTAPAGGYGHGNAF